MKKYDYLIVGAGLYGAVFAHEMNKKGYKCLVIEKRNHIGGNIYTEVVHDIHVHKYGAHIFHTSDEAIWTYINQFGSFNHFINSPLANYKGELYNLPFNMNTFYQIWGESDPNKVKVIIEKQRSEIKGEPKNLEEQAISLVGRDVYEKLIKGYTEKQWGRKCTELPAFIIKRLPVRFTFDNNYFSDRYQGIPEEGYTAIIDKMLENIPVQLDTDYLSRKDYFDSLANQVVYTGSIDAYFDYVHGPLEYRSVRFETEVLECDNYQGNAVVNYTDKTTPYTRIIEHKHFNFGTQKKTVISREYSEEWTTKKEPYYPINNDKNNQVYKRYLDKANELEHAIFAGRLGDYKYYNMDQIISLALQKVIELTE
ncbi:MAG: UDP-galactopyranose mutase [Clostridiales bacterium]|nr:UDP-galactopyranose mutase [Clostridiales bacterium]